MIEKELKFTSVDDLPTAAEIVTRFAANTSKYGATEFRLSFEKTSYEELDKLRHNLHNAMHRQRKKALESAPSREMRKNISSLRLGIYIPQKENEKTHPSGYMLIHIFRSQEALNAWKQTHKAARTFWTAKSAFEEIELKKEKGI